jgi:dipeptidyl-peptidase 4
VHRLTTRAAVLLLLVTTAAAPGAAQDTAQQTADLMRRLFSPGEFSARGFGPARWLDGGRAYTTLETTGAVPEIVRYETADGARSILVSSAQLTPRGGTPLTVEDYEWSPDGRRLLIFTNSRPVWRDNTRGDYWVLDRTSGQLRKLGGTAPESSLLFAKFSPDGTRVGYVRGNNIYVEQLSNGAITQLTRDGSAAIINGTTDWVYEEELALRDAFRWSPDGTRIAYWQFDSTGVGTFPLTYYTGKPREIATGMPYPGVGTYPTIQNFPYPLAGTTNSAARVGVVAAAGGKTTWMQMPGDPRQHYIVRMEWAGSSRELVVQQLNRLQNQADLLSADAATGAVKRFHRDTDKAWLDYNDELVALRGGGDYLWVSESSGWRHAYRVARDGSGVRAVTKGSWDIASVGRVDVAGGWLYYSASPESSTRRALYRARLDGSAEPERLTPAAQTGWHTYNISPDGQWAFHTVSRFDRAAVIDLVRLPEHRSVRVLQDNAALQRAIESVGLPPVEFFPVTAGGLTFDAWLQRPPNFDASKKYPLLLYVYGEPWSQTVTDSWQGNYAKFHMAAARAGYVVASVDTRGTPALKGREWRKSIHGAIGPLASADHAAAVREIVRSRSYIDGERVGVWGWSGGGTSTLNLLFRSPELYAMGMAVAPMPDQRLYDTIYQERYMGLPQDNVAGYRESAINFAEGLRGKLLIVHGTGDDNVHIQATELLVNRLIELGKPFDYFAYPNRTHAINEGAGTTLHLFNHLMRYLRDNLAPGAR